MKRAPDGESQPLRPSWLNRTTLGVGLTSLLSDCSHEIATAILPGFLAYLGAGPACLGLIEGAADGLSSAAKLSAGHYSDRLKRRKPLVVSGYVVTALATAGLAGATSALHVLLARVTAWMGRGARTPGRKAILAAGVPAEAYGRAFGFERMMDTLGAIVGPLTALWLLQQTSHDYQRIFLWTLLPGMLAVACFAWLVKERPVASGPTLSLWAGLRALPGPFRRFLLAVGIFGLGDFSHTLLILYATQALTPQYGAAPAAGIAITLYLLHNIVYAGSAYLGGWLGDHVPRRTVVLGGGYGLAVIMAALLALRPGQIPLLAVVFVLAGTVVGIEEALEDSIAAELVSPGQHGMAFGTLAAVNAVGDFASSLMIGVLWSRASASTAFALAALLFLSGTVLALRLRAGAQ